MIYRKIRTVVKKRNRLLKRYHLVKWSIFITLLITLVFSLYLLFLAKTASVETLKDSLEQVTYIYDDAGNTVGHLKAQKGTYVTLDNISPNVIDALLSTEDRRFYEHSGVDYVGVGRSVVGFLFNGFKITGGGSTLTQQLAKNAYLTQKQTLIRKAQELFLALEIERQYSKDDILTMYLNHAYFGNGVWGIEDAAYKYFGVSAKQLTVPQSAMLIGMLKGPSLYNPIEQFARAKERRNTVLQLMADNHKLTVEQVYQFTQEDMILQDKYVANKTYTYPYFFDAVIDEIEQVYQISEEDLLTKGYKVYTTLNTDYQKQLDNAYAVVDFPSQEVQSTSVLLDSQTGGVKALVGGRGDHAFRGFNRATQMKRQTGSLMKPFIYALALEKGYTPNSIVMDEVRTYGNYTPENYNKVSIGSLPLFQALVESKNTTAVWLLDKLGLNEGIEKIKLFGIPLEKEDNSLAIVLGGLTKGVSPLVMASAYTSFANNGVRSQPYFVHKIEDASGEIVVNKTYTHQTTVITPEISRDMTKMMLGVYESGGTGSSIKVGNDLQIAGKTGTTDAFKDQWIVAYTPDVVFSSWMGYDNAHEVTVSLSANYANSIYNFASIALNNVLSVSPKTAFNLTSSTADKIKTEQESTQKNWLENLMTDTQNVGNVISDGFKNTWDAVIKFFGRSE